MTDTKAQLRQIFRTMNGNRDHEIREASLDEHMYGVTALEAMKHRSARSDTVIEVFRLSVGPSR